MHTMRTRIRLLLPPTRLGLAVGLMASLVLAGCSSTGSGLRMGKGSKLKTSLAVGDRALPVVGGEPGSSIATQDDEPTVEPARGGTGRISGRVYGHDGRPVPNARVRLAVSGAPGGKVVRVSTDESGGFTLHGLRPGADYTVIAETLDDGGYQSGRARAVAPETDVRITLDQSDGADEGPAPASAGRNVSRVSDRDPAEGPSDDLEASPGPRRVNEEDLPPAPEAEDLEAEVGWRGARPGQADGSTEDLVSTDGPTRRMRPVSGPSTAPIDSETHGTAEPWTRALGELGEDEGPNPLPPALEPGEAARPPVSVDPMRGPYEADPFADSAPRVAAGGQGRGGSRTSFDGMAGAFDSPSKPTRPPDPRPDDDDDAPGALVVAPETFAPMVLPEEPAPPRTASTRSSRDEPAPRRTPAPASGSGRSSRTKETGGAADLPAAVEAAEGPTRSDEPIRLAARADLPPAKPTRRPPTWGEVASHTSAPVPLEGGARAGAVGRPPGGRAAAVARRDTKVRGTSSAPASETTETVAAQCEYDDRHRRLIDFRLPDVEGRSVRFSELDADLVLLDFWGTWCQPCLQSIPHMVELQSRVPGKRLKVVGIACETDAPDVASAKVAESVARLKIDYPVLMSRNDGTCPLQEAFHIQALPTMVLLDRQGRVLWRGQGATPATLARLDHMIAAATGGAGTVRR